MEFLPASFSQSWTSQQAAAEICASRYEHELLVSAASIGPFSSVDEIKMQWSDELGSVQRFLNDYVDYYPGMAEVVTCSSIPLSGDQVWELRQYFEGWVKSQAFRIAHQANDRGVLDLLADMRKRTCMKIAEAEAARLRCSVQDVDYHSASWTDASGSADTDFEHLPDAVMHYVFAKLEVYDMVFAMFVCREWRRVGMDYMHTMKRIEHAFTTHMLRRYCWQMTDCARGHTLTYWLKDWDRVGRSLLRWTAGLCEALETIVMTVPLERDMLWSVVNACPRLKHLIANLIEENVFETEPKVIQELGNSSLETIILSGCYERKGSDIWIPGFFDDDDTSEIKLPESLSVLCLADNPVDGRDDYLPATALFHACPQASIWGNLVALEWIIPSRLHINNILSFNCPKLRYLHLDVPYGFRNEPYDDLLDLFLEGCVALSVLILGSGIVFLDDFVRILSQRCPQLQKAWLVNSHETSQFTPETLHQLEECMKMRAVTAQDIRIVSLSNEIEELKQAAPSFTYVSENNNPKPPQNFSLHHREMRRFLGLDF